MSKISNISNKELFLLLTLVIVISLAGTFVSLNKLGQVGVTGLQTSNVTQRAGTTSVTVLGAVQLTIYNNTIAWGAGQIAGNLTPGIDVCNLTTDANIISAGNDFTAEGFGDGGQTTPCDGFTSTTPWSMVLENTGNNPFINVTLAATSGNTCFATAFIVSGTQFLYRIAEEDGSGASITCATGQTTTYATVPTTNTVVCTTFDDATTNDAFLVQFRMDLPEGANATTFSDTISFIGNV